MRDEEYFYPHFGLFNGGTIRITPTFHSSDSEQGLLRALNLKHADWDACLIRTGGNNELGSHEYRGICDFHDSAESSYVAGVCVLTVFDNPHKMILQLEPGDGDGAITSLSLLRDPPLENFLGWVLRKSIDVARAGNETMRKLDKSYASEAGASRSGIGFDESTQGDTYIKSSGEFKEMVMEYMSRDAATFAAAESQLDNLSTWFRDQKEKMNHSVLEISRDHEHSISQDHIISKTPIHSPSRLPQSSSSLRSSVSSPYKEYEAKQNALVRERMDRFRENVEKSIDSAFSNSLESSEEVLVKLYYTGKDPRIPEIKVPEYQYREGTDPAALAGYVQERERKIELENSRVTSEESHAADEALGDNADYQQLKRALGRFQGDVESLIKESFEENEDYRRSLGLDSSFQSNLGKVSVSETPLRKATRGRDDEDDDNDGDYGDGEVTVEEEAAEVQAILQGFLLSHHRDDWGHTDHPDHPHHPHHAVHHKKHSVPHYMISTESSSHHEVDLTTKLRTHENMEQEEAHRSAQHHEQHMIDSIFGHSYDHARAKDKHHGVPPTHAHHAAHSAHHPVHGTTHHSSVEHTRARTASTASASSHTSTASNRTHGTTSSAGSSPLKKVGKVSSSLLAPTASYKAHHSPDTKTKTASGSSSPTKTKTSSTSSSNSVTSAKGSVSKSSKASSAASVDSRDSHNKVSVKSVTSSAAVSVVSKKSDSKEKQKEKEKELVRGSPLLEVMAIAAEIPTDGLVAPLSGTNIVRAEEDDNQSPFGLISEVSSIGPTAQGDQSRFASPTNAGTTIAATDAQSAKADSVAAAAAESEVSSTTVAMATLASLETHYEQKGTRERSISAPREEGAEADVDLGSSGGEEEAQLSDNVATGDFEVKDETVLSTLLGLTEPGLVDPSMTSHEQRQHDASWEPPRENYLSSTFTSTQHEQDALTKVHTMEMIFDEEKARHRHHKDILDPEKAYAREHTDDLSVTSSISDWTIEKETKKKVKRLKKTAKKLITKKK